MTTFQDKQPQSRRALRQEERAERPLTDDIDAPAGEDAETPRVSGRPTGRRARSNFADGLIEVTSADSGDGRPITLPVPSEQQAETSADSTADAPADAPDTSPVWTGPSFGFASLGFDGSSIPPLPSDADSDAASNADDDSNRDAEPQPLDEILAAPDVEDSSVARAFPFAAQVEATSDDDGHQSFTLDEFTPATTGGDETHASAEAESADEPSHGEPALSEATPEQPQGGHELPADWALPASEPVASEPETSEPVGEQASAAVAEPDESTMTRREWRAWRAQKEAASGAAAASGAPEQAVAEEPVAEQPVAEEPVAEQQPVAEPVVEQPLFQTPAPEAPAADSSSETAIPQLVEPGEAPATALSDAMAEFEALTRGNSGSIDIPAAQSAPETPAGTPPVASVVPAIFTVPEFSVPAPQKAAAASESDAPAYEPPTPESMRGAPADAEPAAPKTDTPNTSAPNTNAETTGGTPRVSESSADSAYVPPVGHWSRQAALDDESQPFENTLSRDVGGGNVATTTNALVLPMIPQRDDFSSMINSTGEIMVTGTIDLPMSVGTTGRDSRHYDDPEVDHLFDAFDNEVATTDSAPVRAITAVSSHTATRGGIETGRKQNNRMLTALIVTACVMAVGVFGLLVAGFVFGIF